MLRPLPDLDLSLRDAADFILDSPLGRRAFGWHGAPSFPTFLRDLIGHIHRLTQSCHLAEFTDHGIGHLCSLVDRISRWTCIPRTGTSPLLVEEISAEEAAILVVATLVHDIGMLSQRVEDLPDEDALRRTKGQGDVATWVRQTHIARIQGLLARLFSGSEHAGFLNHDVLRRAITVARAHGSWPWDDGFTRLSGRDSGLAAVVAVADLLDEDSLRCDTPTLLGHRRGTVLNMAHWIRHTLTAGRVLVLDGELSVRLLRPPLTDGRFAPFFSALRNHYRLILLYQEPLSRIGASLLGVRFDPSAAEPVPSEEASALVGWNEIPEFAVPGALLANLLQTFMPLALLDSDREQAAGLARIQALPGVEPVDLTSLRALRGATEVRSPYEQAFRALLEEAAA